MKNTNLGLLVETECGAYCVPLDTAHNHFVKLLAATPTQVLEEIIGPERRELAAQLESLEEDEVSMSMCVCGGGTTLVFVSCVCYSY